MTGMDDFKSVLEDYSSLLGWALGGSVVVPLLAKLAGFAPVWPPAAPFITGLFTLVAIMLSYQFVRQRGRRAANRFLIYSTLAMAAFFILYLYLFARFTFVIPTNKELIYLGCGWSELAISQAKDYLLNPEKGCPGEFERILPAIQYEAGVIWTKESIANVRMFVAVSWFFFFSALSFLIASFAVYQRGR
jgi:hypothetical protein